MNWGGSLRASSTKRGSSRLRYVRPSPAISRSNVVHLAQTETVIKWHRKSWRMWWRWKSRPLQQPGRPRIPWEAILLIRRLSRENPLWGAPRIHGELMKLGYFLHESTVARYMLKRRGRPTQNWKTFLRNHLHETAADRGRAS